jgi:hypothetical protein
MLTYRFKNLNIKCGGQDFLVNGSASYTIESFDDGSEAGFETASLIDALGKEGLVVSAECLGYIAEATIAHLNQDSHLCRSLGNKII